MTDKTLVERYFKVLNTDGTPYHNGKGQWHLPTDTEAGEWMPAITDIELCQRGYHACRAGDLLRWLGPAVFELEYHPDAKVIIGDDKVVGSQARLLRRLNWDERIARHFACDCAERVLPLFEREYPTGSRPRQVIAVARRFANGLATRQELAAEAVATVKTAAWAATTVAWSARSARSARSAAAAWAAAAWSAAAAAWAAAAWSARSAAAAWAAAEGTERIWQIERLLSYLDAPAGTLPEGD